MVGEDVTSTAYEYDSVGNLVKEITDGSVTTYGYNNLNQMTSKTSDTQSSVYAYDSTGSLALEKDALTGRVQARYTNDANGKMIQATSYTYTDESSADTTRIITDTITTERKLDDNGYVTEETTSVESLLTVNGYTLVRPSTVDAVTVDYVYDYTSEVPTLIESYSTDGTVVDYLYAQGKAGVIVSNKKGDDGDDETAGFKQMYNLSTDKNGFARFATDREGNVVAKTIYGTWAEVLEVTKLKVSDTIDVDITSAYTGYIYNEDQKLWNASERVYSPEMKHFTSIDPEPGNVYEKMRVNPYVYVGNNPTTYVDPDGRFFREAGEWIGDKISSITDWIGDKVGAAGEWITESASELLATYDQVICTIRNPQNQIGLKIIIGTIGLAVGVVATAASGGAVLPILSTAFATTAVGGAMGAAGYTISSAVSGAFGLESWNEDSYWTAVQMGAADAYMEFGVTSAVMGYTYYKSSSTTVQYTNEVYYAGGNIPEGVTYEGTIYRSVESKYDPLEMSQHTINSNHRYTEKGVPGLYFSSGEKIVEAELGNYKIFNFSNRTMYSYDVSLSNMLDVSNPSVRSQLGISLDDIIGESYDITHTVGRYAYNNGYNGIIAPSARADGGVNIILFNAEGVR